MLRQTLLLLVTTLALGLAACGGNRATQADAGAGAGMGDGGAGASTAGMGGAGGPEVFREVPGQGTGPLSRLVIYFDYDQSDIRAEYNEVLAAHGSYLAANGGAAGLRLEGHADERGSREYNIGLGERRAQAVRRALLLQGAGAEQLTTVSYGEERPAVFGSDEEAYSLNRRVELVYR